MSVRDRRRPTNRHDPPAAPARSDARRSPAALPSPGACVLGVLLSVLLFSGCSYLSFHRRPPQPGRTTISSPMVAMPAQVVGNFIIVQAKWDRHGPYHFIIDTGSANTLVSPTLVRRYGLPPPNGHAPRVRVASAEGDIIELPTASLRRIELGAARFDDVPVLEYDCAQLSAHLGVHIDGILGFPLFHRLRLTLDYPHHRVLLEPADTTTVPPGTPVPFDDADKVPVIHVGLGDRHVVVLVDSGSDSTVSLNPVGLDARFASGPRPGAIIGTVAGDHPQEIGRLGENLSIANYTLRDPIVDLTDELSAVGGGVLKYFTVTFDAPHDRVVFFRHADGPILMPARRSAGLSFDKAPAYWRIAGVIPGSPAEAAGIQTGDLVTRINGEPVSAWNLTRFDQLVATADRITFTFLYGMKEIEKEVRVFELVP